MGKIRILNLEPDGYSPKAKAVLEPFANVTDGPLSHEELLEQIPGFDALIVRFGHGRIGEELFEKAPQLKAIASATTGLNHIDTAAAEKRNIAVLSLKGEREFLQTIYATPEHTFALLLSIIRHIPDAVLHVRQGGWNRDLFKGTELAAKTIGILGFGRVGLRIAQYAQAFGMKILAYDTEEVSVPPYVTMVGQKELFAASDIISIHVPYDEKTHHAVNAQSFEAMKQGVILLNTSRGEVIDEQALLEALRTGKVGGVALDVLEGEDASKTEWREKNPLMQYAKSHGNALITPHVAGATKESMEKTEIFIAEKLKKFFTEA